MGSHGSPSRPDDNQSIPLRHLSRPRRSDDTPDYLDPVDHHASSRSTHSRTGSLLGGRTSRHSDYSRISAESPTREGSGVRRNSGAYSDLGNLEDFADAHIGLSFVDPPSPPGDAHSRPPRTPHADSDAADGQSALLPQDDDDLTPLTQRTRNPPARERSKTLSSGSRHERTPKRSSVHFLDVETRPPSRGRSPRLGDDLPSLNTPLGLSRKPSGASGVMRLSQDSLRPSERMRSTSASPSPLARAGSIFREISERVVNISNDSDIVEQSMRRKSSTRRARGLSSISATSAFPDIENIPEAPQQIDGQTGERLEKQSSVEERPQFPMPVRQQQMPNPLRGNSWCIFGPENPLRKFLLEVLTHPWTEPVIFILIIAQTVFLAVNAATDAVYLQARTREWGRTAFDYGIFALFCIYTIELVARTIVSGFLLNASEYSTIDRSRGYRQGVKSKLGALFAMYEPEPEREPHRDSQADFQPTLVRAFTGLPDVQGPGHGRQKQRIRLARRAFLRHSFNRLDFVAVVAYWISFSMQITSAETRRHVYIFGMLSCLRTLRLLGLTSGTTIILRSLKKAAPLLVNVAFLICFFWLIFGIVGVQSFKSSLRRTCVWVGDDGSGQNYTLNIAPENVQFCGGYLNATTGDVWPWLHSDGRNGTKRPKGYICPQNSLCVESGQNPYNNTVSFDNIVQSLELVFVVISANTWSDLMYYLADADYLFSAVFFALGIVVMSLWLVNLLIAVITSSFQIIREESKQSAFTAEQIDEPVPAEGDEVLRESRLKKILDKTQPFWILLITFDLIVMCFRSSIMRPWRESFIMNTETVVTLLLLVEILLRFVTDWRRFFLSKRNWFDLGLAVITTVMQIPPIRHSGLPYAWLSAFQIMRIYRVVLAVRVTRELVMIVFGNAMGLVNLILFLFLFTFLAAILASQLFRGDIPPSDAADEWIQVQFFDIWNSFIGMYIILSSENWTSTLYNISQFNVLWDTAWLGSAFCILWFIVANMIVLNMFIAVIQESFDVSEDEKRLQQVKAFLKQKEMSNASGGNLALSAMFKIGRDPLRRRDPLEYGGATMEQLLKDAVVKDFLDEQAESTSARPTSMFLSKLPTAAAVTPGFMSRMWTKVSGGDHKDPNPFYTTGKTYGRANEEFDPRSVAKQVAWATDNRRRAQRQYLARHPRYNVSLFLFKPDNHLRKLCQYLVGPGRGDERVEGVAPWKPAWFTFSALTYAAIVAMVVIACVTTPLYQREYFLVNGTLNNNWLVWTDLGFAVVFTLEALIKIIADGFLYTPNAYFRSVWGLLDVVVLISLWISVFTTLFREDSITRGVGALKALRALRLLNISDSTRNTFHSVVVIGGYKIISAAFVSMSLLIPFAILGLNLFNGTFESCNDGDFSGSLTNCVGEFNSTPFKWPVLAPRTVSNPQYDFDDFGSALFILFQIVSQEGWTGVLQSGMDVVGKGLQPQTNSAQGNAVYFIMFNLLGAVFVLTLFISVFMRNYTEQTGVAYLTADQRSWLELRKILKQISPLKKSLTDNSKSWHRWCYRIASRKRGAYPRVITSLLLLHLLLLVIEFYPEPSSWEYTREVVFFLLVLVFMSNMIIRLVGLTWDRFRRSSWDLFSLLVIPGTLITSVMALSHVQVRAFDQAHKLFLVSLTFLLIPRNNQLDQLFKTAAASLPLIGNLLATWFVLFLVYAIALTQAFALTRFGEHESGNINFRTVPKALILLFRTSIGEGWNNLMEDFATITPPFCVVGDTFFDSDCGSSGWARSLFISWNIISMYIFVSLFVSLIFESFSYVYQRSSGLSILSRDEVRRFKLAWSDFDPKGTGYISREEFPRLLGELSGVFQMRIYDGDFTVRNLLEDCSVQPGDPMAGRRRIVAGIDLDRLNDRLSKIPVGQIRARRQKMNVFYHEMLQSADPERGVAFTSCLMILAHYNLITDAKSLRLEEFLRRRARLQRVHETIRRNTVAGFFDMVHYLRRFHQTVAAGRTSRVEGPPQLAIPEILVDHLDESPGADGGTAHAPRDFTEAAPSSAQKKEKEKPPSVPRINTSPARSEPARDSLSPRRPSPGSSPTLPGRLQLTDTSYRGRDRDRSPPTTPTLTLTPGHSRQGSAASAVGAQGVMESFDASAWGESLRRSFTTRRRSDQ